MSALIKFLQELNGQDVTELEKMGVETSVVEDLKKVIKAVNSQALGYSVVFEYSLVRGMGYYTGMIFEIAYGDLGLSLGGGGRYDKMIGKFLKQDVSACGFSIGFERIVDMMSQMEFDLPLKDQIALIYDKNKDEILDVIAVVESLRKEDNIVSIIPRQKKLSKQLVQLKEQRFVFFCLYSKEKLQLKSIE